MTDREILERWHAAIKERAELAERRFTAGKDVTPEDTVAVALHHPESYEIAVRLKGN